MASKKLLVADDSLTIQKVIKLALSHEGYEIQTVADGKNAIQQIAVFRPDCVLIDVSLPIKSAFQVKREINHQEDLSSVQFILMSSAFEKMDEAQVLEVGFQGRLTKPFDPAHLRQILIDVLATATATGQSIADLMPPPLSFSVPPPLPQSWESPISESDYPILPPPLPTEEVHQLWDQEGTQEIPMPPPLPSNENPEDEADIRELTASTIRISKLDEHQWTVTEPTLKPPGSLLDSNQTAYQLDYAEEEEEDHSYAPPPPLPDFQVPSLDFPHSPPPPLLEMESEPETHAGNAFGQSVSIQQVEAMIQAQVQKTLERMAHQLLPEMAEKLIKQEIHKILSE